MAPLLLLDVDGVLNALDRSGDDAWPAWRHGRATADGSSWQICWAPGVIDQLVAWHEAGTFELQWLTTWGHDANRELRALLGLPPLPVAGTWLDEPEAGKAEAAASGSHAAATPSAPDLLAGRWWKGDVVRRLLAEHPGRRVVWVDDELHDRANPFLHWAQQHPDVVPVGPDPLTGLTPADLDQIGAAR